MAVLKLAWWNLENLFEAEQHPELGSEWSSALYEEKIRHTSSVITALHEGAGPDLLGICEVASDSVISDLIAATTDGSNYAIVHAESPDPRRIDVAFIYRKSMLSVIDSKAYNVRLRYPTRDILEVSFQLNNGGTLHVIGNHWPPRSIGQYETEPYRIFAAETCSWIVKQYYDANPDANLLVMGDFNDEPFNRSIQEYLLAIRDWEEVAKTKSIPYLYNLSWRLMNGANPGTYYYGLSPSSWKMMDQIMVSRGLITAKQKLAVDKDSLAIFHPTWICSGSKPKPFRKNKSGWIRGYSDHFPITASIQVE